MHPTTRKVYDCIKTYIRENGYGPTAREIQELCSLSSPRLVTYHLDWLIENGYLEKPIDSYRTLRVVS